jgi:hypothetical protein
MPLQTAVHERDAIVHVPVLLVEKSVKKAFPSFAEAARACRVSKAAIHKWIQRGNISLLVHALRLSRATGVPIEQFAAKEEHQNY